MGWGDRGKQSLGDTRALVQGRVVGVRTFVLWARESLTTGEIW